MIYLDNAATTWPKPAAVINEITECMTKYGANPGRGASDMVLRSGEKVYECRELVSDFFGLDNPGNVIFTSNATHALNIVIYGILNPGDHVIYTEMDHNSVMRPIFSLRNKVDSSMAHADENGYVSAEKIEQLIRPNTALIVMTHVSNVCGTIMPAEKVAEIAHRHNIPFLLDASQSAGILDIDMKKQGIDFLAAPGHKSLYGPMGTGVLCINSDIALNPLICGGTGSYSSHLHQPRELPDRFESGTLNVPGICALAEGIRFINQNGKENILKHELSLTSYLLGGLSENKKISIIGVNGCLGRTGVISFCHSESDSVSVSDYLNSDYSIATRAGYHCAYKAHEALKTSENGTVRVSLGVFNDTSDIKILLYALEHM